MKSKINFMNGNVTKNLFQMFIPLFLAMIPFVFFFFYLLSITSELTTRSYGILIIQNILISIIAGITLSDYVMNNGKKNDTAWLLIFGLLSVSQYFIVFVERYFCKPNFLILLFSSSKPFWNIFCTLCSIFLSNISLGWSMTK